MKKLKPEEIALSVRPKMNRKKNDELRSINAEGAVLEANDENENLQSSIKWVPVDPQFIETEIIDDEGTFFAHYFA